MKKKFVSCMAVPLVALSLTACIKAPDDMGNTDHSIDEVAMALTSSDMRRVITDTRAELIGSAENFGTTFEFERDILICEQLHQPSVSVDSPDYGADPESDLLSDCLNGTIASHDMMEDAW